MGELGHLFGDEPATSPRVCDRVVPEAVVRADLWRSRQAAAGTQPHPEAILFASQLAWAVVDALAPAEPTLPDESDISRQARRFWATAEPATDPRPLGLVDFDASGTGVAPVLPAPRDAGVRAAPRDVGPPTGPGVVALPAAPALVCDRSERIVRVNAALLALAGRAAGTGDRPGVRSAESARGAMFGMRLSQLVVGPDTDARLVRSDGTLVRVHVVRWDLPGDQLSVAVLVELDDADAVADRLADRRWITELERMARVGTWSYELATATLRRGEALDELYRSVGVHPDRNGSIPVECEQVELLCRSLRTGALPDRHHVELRLPGNRRLSCRAEVEYADDGTPVRLAGVVRDLSVERVAQHRVEHSGQRFVDLMALMPAGVVLLDPAGRVVDANAGLCEVLDVGLDRLLGTAATDLSADGFLDPTSDLPGHVGPDRVATLPGWLRRVPPGAEYGYRCDAVPLKRGDGTTVWCELAVSSTPADDGGWYWMVVCTDISERRRAAELVRSAGTVDELTRLPNRAAALELVDRLLAGPGRDRVAVVCGDLDDFARVNSSLGHEAGDDLLVTLAGRLQRGLPVWCTAARLSGDEFLVVCADHTEVGGPEQLAGTVADLLRSTVTVRGQPVQITASVGLATAVHPVEVRAADLLRFAEAAMHDAKRRHGRGGIGMATDGVVSSATRALELEAELRAVIAGGGLVLHYQPVVGPDGAVASAEALVRWPHPVRGLIAPADFLPVAQRSGLLRELDLWVLRTAAQEAATWPVHCGRRPAVAVNLAGLLPGEADFLPVVSAIVADTGLAWDRLVLELVETSLVALAPHALAAMAELVERGVRFAVDDFGTGYSSLARLKELPAQTIKVDRAFVTGIADDPADFAVARAVVDMARAMGRTTVAEGVETAAQFHALREIGVDAYQGWLFSRSLPAAALHEVLAGGRLATPAPPSNPP